MSLYHVVDIKYNAKIKNPVYKFLFIIIMYIINNIYGLNMELIIDHFNSDGNQRLRKENVLRFQAKVSDMT